MRKSIEAAARPRLRSLLAAGFFMSLNGAFAAPAESPKHSPAQRAPAAASAPKQVDTLYEAPKHPLNPDEQTDAIYHDSGTIGRDELGADPHHPEGPAEIPDTN